MPHAGYSKRITALVRDIWSLQLRLSRRQGKRAHKLMEQPKFRAAFDLLALRAQAENNHELQRLTQWWDEFQKAPLTRQKAWRMSWAMMVFAAVRVAHVVAHRAVKAAANDTRLYSLRQQFG